MCVYNVSKTEVLEKDTYFYKVVVKMEGAPYLSRYSPNWRVAQSFPQISEKHKYALPQGKTLTYKIGEKQTSSFENSPGLYCYTSITAALSAEVTLHPKCVILMVRIPKNTRIKRAKSSEKVSSNDVILAEELTPILEVPQPQ